MGCRRELFDTGLAPYAQCFGIVKVLLLLGQDVVQHTVLEVECVNKWKHLHVEFREPLKHGRFLLSTCL